VGDKKMRRFLARMVNRFERLEKNDNLPFTLNGSGTCFILGNGPSLNKITKKEWNKLSDYFTIGVNSAYKIHECSLYCCADKVHIERHCNEMRKVKPWLLFESARKMKRASDFTYTHLGNCTDWNKISFDISKGVYSGNTVVIEAIQVALSAGCKEIYLLGVDLDYSGDSYFYGNENLNPIHPDGRKDIQPLIDAFKIVKQECDKRGVEIINLNPESKLKVFPKQTLKEAFKWRW